MVWNHRDNLINQGEGWNVGLYDGKFALEEMQLTEDWGGSIVGSNSLANSRVCTSICEIEVSQGDKGIIQEAGATGYGFCLYLWDDKIYFQAGSGEQFGYASSRSECILPVPFWNQKFTVIWSSSILIQKTNLYIDDIKTSSYTSNMIYLCGSDPGGIAKSHTRVCINRGGWVNDGEGIFEGIIHSCKIYQSQFLDI